MSTLSFLTLILNIPLLVGASLLGPITPQSTGEYLFIRDTVVEHYVEYRSGNFPLILSVPHGGSEEDDNFVARTKENSQGRSVLVGRDGYTIEMANAIDSIFYERTGKHPYVVIAHLRRRYIDMNRSRALALPRGRSPQEYIYDIYHTQIEYNREDIERDWGAGLLIDIHGHGHKHQLLELGYCVSKRNLNLDDREINRRDIRETSSIQSLARKNRGDKSLAQLIRGENSLGDLLEAKGVPTIPHSGLPKPKELSYFSGGYISKAHGSRGDNESRVDAIQFEFGRNSRRDRDLRLEYAEKVVDALLQFIEENYPFKKDPRALD